MNEPDPETGKILKNGQLTNVGRFPAPPLARYANYFEIGYNAYEFLVDAGQVEPQSGEIQLVDRFAIGPVYAKLLAQLLHDSVSQFESTYQKIPDFGGDATGEIELTNPLEFERLAISVRRQPPKNVPQNSPANPHLNKPKQKR